MAVLCVAHRMGDMPTGAEPALVGVEPPSAAPAQEREAGSPVGRAAGRVRDLGRARSLPKALGSGDAQVDRRRAEHLVPSSGPGRPLSGRHCAWLVSHFLSRLPGPADAGKSACIAAATLWP